MNQFSLLLFILILIGGVIGKSEEKTIKFLNTLRSGSIIDSCEPLFGRGYVIVILPQKNFIPSMAYTAGRYFGGPILKRQCYDFNSLLLNLKEHPFPENQTFIIVHDSKDTNNKILMNLKNYLSKKRYENVYIYKVIDLFNDYIGFLKKNNPNALKALGLELKSQFEYDYNALLYPPPIENKIKSLKESKNMKRYIKKMKIFLDTYGAKYGNNKKYKDVKKQYEFFVNPDKIFNTHINKSVPVHHK